MDFNDFIQLWRQLGATLGALGHNLAQFGCNLEQLGHNLAQLERNLAPLERNLAPLECNLAPLGRHLGHLGATWVSLGCHLGLRGVQTQRKMAQNGAKWILMDFPEPFLLSKALSKLLVLLYLCVRV